MKTVQSLPSGYSEIFSVDLQKNKKIALAVNIAAIVIAVAMIVPMLFFVPISGLFDMSRGFGMYFLRYGILIVGMVVYMILHELVHGITMKIFGAKRIKYGFTGMYAYAGSENDYFSKVRYIIIALAPVVIWGAVLLLLNLLLPLEWFWVVYIIQIINISGAAGDMYVTAKFLTLPSDILVKDIGVSMTVYSASGER